ncbi:MAG: restriction endonuclease subunit S [Solirubrobacteraceae bacterium]
MSEWRETTLGDVLTLQRGFDLPARDRLDGPYPIVSSSGVTGYHSVAKVDPPGVVIGRYGSLGSVHWLTEPYWPHNTALWIKEFKGNDPRFTSYLLRTISHDGSAAAAVPGVNRNHLHALRVRVPDVVTQRRIAAVLTSFDELIAINERRIDVLEGLARSLYREWFVRYRFPGHELHRDDGSAAGEPPNGWPTGNVEDFLNVVGGGTPSKREPAYWNGGSVDWYTPSDLTRSSNRFAHESSDRITDLGVQKSAARLFPPGSVLMTSRATLGVLAIATSTATCNQGFIVISPSDGIPPTFVYEWLSDQESRLRSIATGATFKEITKGAFKRFPFVMPSVDVMAVFTDVVSPIERQIATLECASRAHARTRDLLLFRLVSGRLDISEIDLGDLLASEAA